MSLRVILSITHCQHDSSFNQSEIYEQRFNSGIKQSKLPQVPHFRKDWSPPRSLLVRFNLLQSEIRPPGDGKVHVSANENITASAGTISFFREDPGRELEGWGLFLVRQSQVDALLVRFTKKILYATIKFIAPNSQIHTLRYRNLLN